MRSDALEQLAPPPPAFGPNLAPVTLPVGVESRAALWGLPETEQLPPSDVAPALLTVPHTLDFWERERIFDSIRCRLIEIKIAAGMASRWPRIV